MTLAAPARLRRPGGGSVSGVQCVRWHSGLADRRHVALRRREVTVTSKSELCSAGVLGYVTAYIIIRRRPRPAECQPLVVRSRPL